MDRGKNFLAETRGSSTVEFALMLMVYVVILFGLLVVTDMGMLAKRVQTEARVLAWNTLCPDEIDNIGIRDRLQYYHSGELIFASVWVDKPDPSSVQVADNSSAEAQAVLNNAILRMNGQVSFDYLSPWSLGYPGDEDGLQNEWVVERTQTVDTRTNVMYMPPVVVPYIVIHHHGGSGGGGSHTKPPPDNKPPQPTP